MELDFFSQSLAEICRHSLVSPGRPLRWTVIANPGAGGFVIRSRRKAHIRTFREYRQKALENPSREIHEKSCFLFTEEKKGSGEEIARNLIDEAAKDTTPFYLIITASGDGTCLEVLTAIYNTPAYVRFNMAVLRLPMGTGNDSADSAKLAGALDLLIKPVYISFAPALRLITALGGPAYEKGQFIAFNILSVGLDAFVTHITNKIKRKFPGDSYKLCVDIAVLFYERLYKVDYIEASAFDKQNLKIRAFREKLLLLAMGVSGHRTYGAGKKILPDERNVCGIKQTTLSGKVALRNLVVTGRHEEDPNTILFSARRIEFSAANPILAQMDGETVLLQPQDFPAAIEITAPVIPLLKRLSEIKPDKPNHENSYSSSLDE